MSNAPAPNRNPRPWHLFGPLGFVVGLILAVIAFNRYTRDLLPQPPGGGFNHIRALLSGVVGLVGGVLGRSAGSLLDRPRRRPK